MGLNRTTRTLILSLAVVALVVCAFGAGAGATWLLLRGLPFGAGAGDREQSFAVFWEAWDRVEEYFYADLPDAQHLAWGAIRGALATLDDPHTAFLEPQPRQREREELSGKFGGIGAQVSQAEDGSIVLDPMPDLPAEKAGILKGDAILQVDDREITPGMTVDDVVTLVRGEVGTVVRLTIRREGVADPLVFEIERAEIPSVSVEWRMLEEAPGTGYVRISLFSDRSGRELEKALGELEEQGLQRLVLDLRGNGGGLLSSAVEVASEFLEDGVVAYQVQKNAAETVLEVRGQADYPDGPLVVLVDGGTASASEIVAGALRDRGRARLVGTKTYGKGSVQSVFDLSDGSSVHITSAQWLTPNRSQISGQGLAPDAEVGISDEDRSQGADPQLRRALELLATGQ